MTPNTTLGVLYHAIGGLAAASFYLPYKRVKGWSWETYWITGGIFSWLVAPILIATLIVAGIYGVPLMEIIKSSPPSALLATFGFGVLWGIGGLTFGLSMRYLGIGLGYAVALGFCAAFGQIVPPIFAGGYFDSLAKDRSTQVILGGVVICLLGIVFSGAAGMRKEKELTDEQKKKTTSEFSLVKGLIIATICGLLSACFSFALSENAGGLIGKRALELKTPALWQGLPALIVVMAGGLLTNAIWCAILLAKNKSFGQFAGKSSDPQIKPPLATNYLFSALAGLTWYFQFFFYTMGSSQLGDSSKYSSWTLHMACIIIFSTFWGILLKEWKGTSLKTHWLIALGLGILILSTTVVGVGNYLAPSASDPAIAEVRMQAIYDEIKTPFKYGVVIEPPEGKKVDCPTVFRHGDRWYMIYVQLEKKPEEGYTTQLAQSDDLLHWKPMGAILDRGDANAWDAANAGGGAALFDTKWNGTNALQRVEDRYWLSYIGGKKIGYEVTPLSIGLAFTANPTTVQPWQKIPAPILRPDDADARDKLETVTLYKSFIFQDNARTLGARFVMFYNAKGTSERIFTAVSDDMRTWKRYGTGAAVENLPPPGSNRGVISGDPQIVRMDDVWVMFYFGAFWKPGAFNTFAASKDLVHWTKWTGEDLVRPSEPYDTPYAHKSWVIKYEGVVYHFYCAVGGKDEHRTIALATSKDLK